MPPPSVRPNSSMSARASAADAPAAAKSPRMASSSARTWSASALFATFATSSLRSRSQKAIPASAGVGPQATGRSRATRAARSSTESPACRASSADSLEVGLALAGPTEHEAGHPDLSVRPREIGEIIGGLQCRGDLECLARARPRPSTPGSTRVRSAVEIEARVRLDSASFPTLRASSIAERRIAWARSSSPRRVSAWASSGSTSSRRGSSAGRRSTPRSRRRTAAGKSARPQRPRPAAKSLTAACAPSSSAPGCPSSRRSRDACSRW